MAFSIELDYQRRLKAQQLQDVKQWILGLASQHGLGMAQSVTPELLDTLLKPAQAAIRLTLDTPDGDRLFCTVHPNGSLVVELELEFFDLLDQVIQQDAVRYLAEFVSDLFHNDDLEFHSALVPQDERWWIRTISSVSSVARLVDLVSEASALKSFLLLALQQRIDSQQAPSGDTNA